MHKNRTFQEVGRKLGHINLPYSKDTGLSGGKKICGHPRQSGIKADASLCYKKLSQLLLSTFEQTIFISSREAPLYFPSKASHMHVVVIGTQSQ